MKTAIKCNRTNLATVKYKKKKNPQLHFMQESSEISSFHKNLIISRLTKSRQKSYDNIDLI